jgi:molybdenum cofactor biosynthesis protein B
MTEREFLPINVAVLTISDTRTLETDTSGALVASKLEALGHRVFAREIVKDDVETIRASVRGWMASTDVQVVIATGGTGLTRRDITPEAVAALGTKHIPGFGELFRMLSYEEIGTSTILSRADAWLCDDTLVFIVPGSTGAVRTAMDRILVEQLDVRHRPCNFIELLPRIVGGA